MQTKLLFTSDGKNACENQVEVNDTVLINFSRDIKTNEYCFSFKNNNHSSLSFTFISTLPIDCYFAYISSDKSSKFTGYHTLQNEEFKVDVKGYEKLFIVIPRNKNSDVCAPLTLVSLYAE